VGCPKKIEGGYARPEGAQKTLPGDSLPRRGSFQTIAMKKAAA